jgi:hypothetical protein
MKIVFFAFKGELLCFNHIMLNARDMNEKGIEIKIVMEGEAVKLIKVLEEQKNELYLELKEKKIFDCICQACSYKMGVLEYNKSCGIPMNGELSGHPSMTGYIQDGYQVITL